MPIQSIGIKNTGSSLSNIQVRIDGLDVFTGEEVEFFSDISLTQPIKFYRADPGTWWIKVNLQTGTNTIYTAWNEVGITGGNGNRNDVFEWFDNFNDLSKWNETDTGANITTASGLVINDGTATWGQTTVYGTTGIDRTIDTGAFSDSFTIDNTGATISGMQVKVSEVGWTGNDMQFFEDASHTQPIDYWRAENNTWWIKTDLPANDTKTVYTLTTGGNDGNGNNVFLFFDDFNSASIDSQWDETTGSPSTTTTSGLMTLNSGDGLFAGGYAIPHSTVIEARSRANAAYGGSVRASTTSTTGWVNEGGIDIIDILSYVNEGIYAESGDGGEELMGVSTANVWADAYIKYRLGDVDTADYVYDPVTGSTLTATRSGQEASETMYPVLYNGSGKIEHDWYFVRKNTSNTIVVATNNGTTATPVVGFKHRWTNTAASDDYSRYGMFGWKDDGAGVSYTDLVYALYPFQSNTDIYEDGTFYAELNEFGNKWQPTNSNETWDSEIVTISGGGAIYQSKREGQSEFKAWYETPNSTETPLRPGIVIHTGGSEWDHVYVRKHPYEPVKVYLKQDIITISNDGAALTDHQVMIQSPFFRDKNVEFFTTSGLDTSLNFWREDEETYWVKTNILPTASGLTNIHFAWGSHLEEKGSGADTFDWFEDWSDGLTGWTYTGTAPTVNELDIMEIQNGAIYPTSSILSDPRNYWIEARMSPRATEAGANAGIVVADTQNVQAGNAGSNALAMLIGDTNGANERNKLGYAADGGAASFNIADSDLNNVCSDDETYIYSIGFDSSDAFVETNRGDISSKTYVGAAWSTAAYLTLGYFTGSGAASTDGQDHRVFWALARKKTNNTLVVNVPHPNKYRAVTITNTGGALTDYQVMIRDRLLDRDIAFFTDTEKSGSVPYWREEPGVYWVKVDLPANDDLVIYAFYGTDDGDTSGGDGDNVFILFDDFEDGTISTSKWDVTGGAAISEFDGKLHGGINNASNYLQSDLTFSTPVRARTVSRETVEAPNGFTPIGFWVSTGDQWTTLSHGGTSYYNNDGGWSNYSFDSGLVNEAPGGKPGYYYGKVEDQVILLGSTSRATREQVTASVFYKTADVSNSVTSPKLFLGDRGDLGNFGQTYVTAWDFMMVTKYADSNTITASVGQEFRGGARSMFGHRFFAQIDGPNNTISFSFGIPVSNQVPISYVHFPKNQRHATIGIRDITFLKGNGDK